MLFLEIPVSQALHTSYGFSMPTAKSFFHIGIPKKNILPSSRARGIWVLVKTLIGTPLRKCLSEARQRFPREWHITPDSRGETIIQVHGIGPFRVDFVDRPVFLTDPDGSSYFKYKLGQRVFSEKGPGVITFGHTNVKRTIVQYEIKKDDGGLFCALEESMKPERPC
jgi:hypothetical protein